MNEETKEKIKPKEFQKICKKLVDASLNPENSADIEVLISVANNSNPNCRVIFYFGDRHTFVMQFYKFYSKKRCETLLNLATTLMKNGVHEYESIKAKYNQEIFGKGN